MYSISIMSEHLYPHNDLNLLLIHMYVLYYQKVVIQFLYCPVYNVSYNIG